MWLQIKTPILFTLLKTSQSQKSMKKWKKTCPKHEDPNKRQNALYIKIMTISLFMYLF